MQVADVLTVQEAAAYLRCGPKVVRRLCRLGRIIHVKLDRKKTVRIHRSALDAFLLEQKGGR
jgi:excisionase family DNA binding protein